MDDQVRIAADRRREVQVVGRREPEVAEVDHVVGRLLERAQQLERQRLFGRVTLEPLEHPLAGPWACARRRRRPRCRSSRASTANSSSRAAVGRVVDPPHRVFAALLEAARDRLVGGQHELLDHRIRLPLAGIAPRFTDVAHQPRIVVVELDERLGDVEVQRAAREPRRAQLAGEACRCARSAGRNGSYLRRLPRVSPPSAAATPGIVEARARMNHRRARSHVSIDLGVAIEVDAHDHRQPIFLRDQRADVRRQRLRQHRDRAVGQVDAAAAAPRLAVERRCPRARSARRRRPRPTAAMPPLGRLSIATASSKSRAVSGSIVVNRTCAQVGAVGAIGVAHLARKAVGDARDRRRETLPRRRRRPAPSRPRCAGRRDRPSTFSTAASIGPSATSG